MKLGLDLKGIFNVLLEINQKDLVSDFNHYSANPIVIENTRQNGLAQEKFYKTLYR